MHLPIRAGRAVVRALVAFIAITTITMISTAAHAQLAPAALEDAGAAPACVGAGCAITIAPIPPTISQAPPATSTTPVNAPALPPWPYLLGIALLVISEVLPFLPGKANGIAQGIGQGIGLVARKLLGAPTVLVLLLGGALALGGCGGTMSPACEAAIVGLVGSSVTGLGAGISIGLQGQPIKVTLPAEVANAGTNGTTILSAALAAENLCKGTEPVVTSGALVSAVKAAVAPPALQSVQPQSTSP